jgi:hypothetical protein
MSIGLEHQQPDRVLATVGVDNPDPVARDLENMAVRLCSLNPSLTPEEAMALGLLQGFSAGVRAARGG